MTYRTLFIIGTTAVLCVSCTSQKSSQPSTTKTMTPIGSATLGCVRRLSDNRRFVLGAQQEYLLNEGVAHRGKLFYKLVSTIEEIKIKEPPVAEVELLELLGPPDYDDSDENGPAYIYFADVNARKDAFIIFDIDIKGYLQRVGYNMTSTLDLKQLKPHKPWPVIP